MSEILLDTNIIVACLDTKDAQHAQAKAIVDEMQTKSHTLIYLDAVIAETVSTLTNKFKRFQRLEELAGTLTKLRAELFPNRVWTLNSIEQFMEEAMIVVEQM
jgi:predicted nucleic acid-binding protein